MGESGVKHYPVHWAHAAELRHAFFQSDKRILIRQDPGYLLQCFQDFVLPAGMRIFEDQGEGDDLKIPASLEEPLVSDIERKLLDYPKLSQRVFVRRDRLTVLMRSYHLPPP